MACSYNEEILPTEKEEKPNLVKIKANVYKDINSKNIHIIDLPGDINKTMKEGHIPVYFSLEEIKIVNSINKEGKLLELSEELKNSNKWDVCFGGIYNSEITVNTKSINNSDKYLNNNLGMLYVIDTPYFKVKKAPTDEDFKKFMKEQVSVAWNDYPKGHLGWYFYSLDSHVMKPVKGRTIIIKTAKGNFAKIEIKSLYLNNPEKPTIHTPAPYFNFRFYLQKDGSRNLNSN